MQFNIEEKPSLVTFTNANGYTAKYPTYAIGIDTSLVAADYPIYDINPISMAEIVRESEDEIDSAISRIIARHVATRIVSRSRCRVEATLVMQEYDDYDCAFEVGRTRFDMALALDREDMRGFVDSSDLRRYIEDNEEWFIDLSVELGLVDDHGHDGWLEGIDDRQLDMYLTARKGN